MEHLHDLLNTSVAVVLYKNELPLSLETEYARSTSPILYLPTASTIRDRSHPTPCHDYKLQTHTRSIEHHSL